MFPTEPDLHAGRGTCFFSDGQFFQGDWTEAPADVQTNHGDMGVS